MVLEVSWILDGTKKVYVLMQNRKILKGNGFRKLICIFFFLEYPAYKMHYLKNNQQNHIVYKFPSFASKNIYGVKCS